MNCYYSGTLYRLGKNSLSEPPDYLLVPAENPVLLIAVVETRGRLEPGSLAVVLSLLRKGGLLVDVGANIGTFSLPAARLVGAQGHVLAMEPAPRVAALLCRTVALNEVADWVEVRECAAGDGNGTVPFGLSRQTTHNSMQTPRDAVEQTEVPIRRLDDLFASGRPVDVFKIDVGGGELQVWRGMQRIVAENPQPAIVLEFGPERIRRARNTVPAWFEELTSADHNAWEIDEASSAVRPLRQMGIGDVFSLNILLIRDDPRSRGVRVGSGNNGRAAILAINVNGSGQNEYLMVGNPGNGSGTEPADIVADTGVQSIIPGSTNEDSTVIGALQGNPGSANGFEFGFAVAQLGSPADKSGKDDNFRGLAIFDNTLYVTKGSGGNGIDTVYQVRPGHAGLPLAADGPTTQISILPGFPANLASAISEKTPATEFYPFGLWFGNATTLYVADEGSQDLNADPNAGLQKWIFDGSKWTLAYTVQTGLNLDQPYDVADPTQYHLVITGLRNLTGFVQANTVRLFATTATLSSLGDPGADPNSVVQVVDQLDATTLPADEMFRAIAKPRALRVYRGVAYINADEN